jgi:hypothetical protein
MPNRRSNPQNAAELRLKALSRWENEGGAGPAGPQDGETAVKASLGISALGDAELIQLRVRVIALENLMVMMLAEGSERQLQLAREMAAYISPRPGFTTHPLTTLAAAHMVDLVQRAIHYRGVDPA